MNKSISIIGLLLTSVVLSTNAQSPVIYSEVIQVDSVSKNELYSRAKIWFVKTYKSSKDVLQLDDKEDGKIIGKAVMKYVPSFLSGSSATKGYINYTISVFVKEGRYKYEITDFMHDPDGFETAPYSVNLITTEGVCPNPKAMAKKWSDRVWVDIKDQIDRNTLALVADLKKNMSKEQSSGSDDW